MKITFFYAALLAILFVLLSIRTIRVRRSLKIAVGDAGNPKMLRAMRVHSNFSEYVPLSLLMARGSHAYGLSQEKENFKFRVGGMMTTFTVILLCSGVLVFSYFFGSVK